MKLGGLESGKIDIIRGENGGILLDQTLISAVLISLFTDARAKEDDVIPDSYESQNPMTLNRRGWCGDALDENSLRIGSRLWLLHREKQTEETRLRAIDYAKEALQWLIDDGHIREVKVQAEWHGNGRLDLRIIYFVDDKENQIYVKDVLHAV